MSLTSSSPTMSQRALQMFALILAGEAVYALPFHIARFYRPTLLEVFNLTPTELGAAQGVYGVVAMLAYFPGGPLADRFPARKLLAFSLFSTASGGLYMATFPGYQGALLVWGFFGVTTILLFWAALIRATRELGGADAQGRAYGVLDGGRGLLAALLASLGALVLAWTFPEDVSQATTAEKAAALRTVIYGYTGFTALAGVFVWFALPKDASEAPPVRRPFVAIGQVLRLPAVWLQAAIVVCAYVGFKGIDNYSLYAVQVHGLNEVEAAELMAWCAWSRPVAALGAGWLGDRLNVPMMLTGSFVLLLVSHLIFAFFEPAAGEAITVLIANTLLASIAVFALRGIYFAVFAEARVPAAVTGTAVGIVSVIGYTPDIFVTLVAGLMIDATPGVAGHQHFFLFLSAFSAAGVLAAAAFWRYTSRDRIPTNG